MVVRNFEIETYSVAVSNSRAPSLTPGRRRVINLAGTVLAHGIQTRATLYFLPFTPSSDYIGGVFTSNYFQYTLLGWLPIGEYDEFYQVLQTEKPVYCRYVSETDDPFNITTPLSASGVRSIEINTGDEPVGEGLGDQESAINDLIGNLSRRFEVPSLHAGIEDRVRSSSM